MKKIRTFAKGVSLRIPTLLFMSILLSFNIIAQTNPTAQSLPYSQDFSGLSGSSTTFPAGWQSWLVSSAIPSAAGRITAPASDKTISGGTAASTSSGAYDFNGKIGFMSISGSDVALCLAVNTTDNSNIKVTFDAMTLRNLYDGSTNNYILGLVLQYRVGTTGTFTTITYLPSEYQNGTSSQSTGTTGQNINTGLNAILPSVCENQSVVQIRWIFRIASGNAGKLPSMAIDNVTVNQIPVVFTTGWPKAENATASGFTVKSNINTPGTTYYVILPSGSTPFPSSAQVTAGQDGNSILLPANQQGSITHTAGSTEYVAAVSGLSSNSSYDVYFVSQGNSVTSLQSTPTKITISTTSSANVPTITTPTAITITNNSATLGGNITSDGGSAITDRGTVWKTITGVTISDNLLTEGGATTGIFSHSRTSLPAKSQIFYKAYATNSIGTSLTSESNFFTLANEPTSTVGSFAANTVSGSITSLNLTWTAATGADGYIIIQKAGAAAAGTAPSDATSYTVGSTLGTGTVAAVVTSGTSQTITGLTANTQYTFRIYPFGYDGSNAQTFNYTAIALASSVTATTKASPTISVSGTQSFTYTGLAQGPATIAYNGDGSTSLAYTSTDGGGYSSAIAPTNAGAYQVVASATEGTNYIAATSAAYTFTIGKATPTVIPIIGTYTYTGSAQGPNSATTGGSTGTITYSYVSTDGTTYPASATAPTVAGSYTVTATVAADANYNSASSVATAFTIAFASVTVTTNTNISTLLTSSGTDLTVSSGELVVDQASSVKSITVAPGAKLTLGSGVLSTVNGVTLQSDASGTGTLVDNTITSPQTISNAIVQQYLPQGRNWYLSSPVTTGNTSSLTTTGASTSVSYYDEPSSSWVNSYSGTLYPGIGYVGVSANGTGTNSIQFSGTLNTGNINVPLTNEGSIKAGFNLVANPYASYLNVMTAINVNSNIQPSIWYRTQSTGGTYYFETLNTISGLGTNDAGTGTVTGYVPPMQAFWVRTNVDNQTLTFTNAMRYHANPNVNSSSITTTPMKTPSQVTQQLLRLRVSNGTNSDEAIVYFNPQASDGFDAYDSEKMPNNNPAIPEIYTTVGSQNLVIDGLNSIITNPVLPLGFTTGSFNTFTIKATEVANFDAGNQIILKDNLLNTQQDMTNGTAYTFTSDVVSTTSRFSIVFKSVGVTTGVQDALGNQSVLIYKNANNKIAVNLTSSISDNGYVSVYNALGQKLELKKLTGTTTIVDKAFTSGVYLVTVNNGGIITTKKVILN